MKKEIITVKEYEKIVKERFESAKDFNELFHFALSEKGKDVFNCFNGYLKAKNYAGVIQTKSGQLIEILPKIHDEKGNEEESKEVLL